MAKGGNGKSGGRGLFGQRHTVKYPGIVSMGSRDEAANSIVKLKEEFNSAKTRAKQTRVKRVAVSAGNIAGVMARNHNNSPDVRAEKAVISGMYHDAAKGMVATRLPSSKGGSK